MSHITNILETMLKMMMMIMIIPVIFSLMGEIYSIFGKTESKEKKKTMQPFSTNTSSYSSSEHGYEYTGSINVPSTGPLTGKEIKYNGMPVYTFNGWNDVVEYWLVGKVVYIPGEGYVYINNIYKKGNKIIIDYYKVQSYSYGKVVLDGYGKHVIELQTNLLPSAGPGPSTQQISEAGQSTSPYSITYSSSQSSIGQECNPGDTKSTTIQQGSYICDIYCVCSEDGKWICTPGPCVEYRKAIHHHREGAPGGGGATYGGAHISHLLT